MAHVPVRLHGAQHHQASRVLAAAFQDDPCMIDALPDEGERRRALPGIMAMNVAVTRCHGEVWTTDDSIRGVALWLPPQRPTLALWDLILFGGLGIPFQAGTRGTLRLLRSVHAFEQEHQQVMRREAHWYLFMLGVEPECQGQGIGSALLAPMLARADSEGLPVYLETCQARNVPFYERHGFIVAAKQQVPGGGPVFWAMRRQPQA